MIERTCHSGDIQSEALYSDCLSYRYRLTRVWGPGLRVLFLMLNPSTASEVRNDPTVARCERRCRALGSGAYRVTNLFAFRATDPGDMRRAADPVGPLNDAVILDSATGWADLVICAWGNHGRHLGRGSQVEALLRARGVTLHHLGLTGQAQPRHPLYCGFVVQPQPWPDAQASAS